MHYHIAKVKDTSAEPSPPLVIDGWHSLGLSSDHPIRAVSLPDTSPVGAVYRQAHCGMELGVVLAGHTRRIYRNYTVDLEPGQVWYCGIWEMHAWQVLDASYRDLVVTLLPEALAPIAELRWPHGDALRPFRVPPAVRPQAEGPARQEVLALTDHLIRKLGKPNERAWIRLLTAELLLLLQRMWTPPGIPQLGPGDPSPTLSAAIELVLRSRQPVRVREAAAACGMGVSNFSRLFSRLMGVPFAQFALQFRLTQATTQLLRTDDPVKQIASQWGFSSGSHLHHLFCQHYGRSPGSYRRLHGLPNERSIAPRRT